MSSAKTAGFAHSYIQRSRLSACFFFSNIPETKKISLEEIDALFGGRNHATQGEMFTAKYKQNKMDTCDQKASTARVEDFESKNSDWDPIPRDFYLDSKRNSIIRILSNISVSQ